MGKKEVIIIVIGFLLVLIGVMLLIQDKGITGAVVASAINCPSGMVSYWPFDEGSGNTAGDACGSNDGTLRNGPTWTRGQVNDGLDFDGSDDSVNLSTMDVSGSGLTIAAWFNADDFGTHDARIISKATSQAKPPRIITGC